MARIWRSQPPRRGRAQAISTTALEELVFARLYFDPRGFIVACKNNVPVGFVHAGFGPAGDLSRLAHETGVISALMVLPDLQDDQFADELLSRAEAWLRGFGVRQILAGGAGRDCPFYLGLLGGSGLPGVLLSEPERVEFFQRQGYAETDRIAVYHRELSGFRPIMDRVQLQIRRNTRIEIIEDPQARSWWESCTLGGFEQSAIHLLPRNGGDSLASAHFWDLGPLAATWGLHAQGVIDITVLPERRREGLATNVLGEGMKLLHEHGVTLLEAQAPLSDAIAGAFLSRLGFVQVDCGVVLQKSTP